jgi:hypothetical protein
MRPALLFVDRHGQHPVVIGEGVLHAVAMVRVQVHVQHALHALRQERQHGEHGIVEIAEAAGAVGPPVVGAARGVKHDTPIHRQLRGVDRTADGGGSALEQAGEQRVFHGADAVTVAHRFLHAAAGIGQAQRLYVVGPVKLRQLRHAGLQALAILSGCEPAQYAAQVNDAGNADDRKGMVFAEGRLPVHIAADEEGLCSALSRAFRDINRHLLAHDAAIVFDFTNK